MSRRCLHCGTPFEPTKGNQRYCKKKCYAVAYCAANWERCAARRAANRAREVKYQAAYYAANRPRITNLKAAHYMANRDKILKRRAAYRAAKRKKLKDLKTGKGGH